MLIQRGRDQVLSHYTEPIGKYVLSALDMLYKLKGAYQTKKHDTGGGVTVITLKDFSSDKGPKPQ